RGRSFVGSETVANSADGFEKVRGSPKFFAQPPHVGVDGSTIDRSVVTPDVEQEAVAGLYAPATPREYFQEFELGGREINGVAFNGNFMPGHIEFQLTKTQL